MQRVLKLLHLLLKILTSSVIVTLLIVLSWQVFTRYVLKNPSTVTEELSRFLLIILGTTGASFTFMEKKHLALDWLLQKAGPASRKWLSELNVVATILLGAALFIGGCMMIREKWTLGQTSPVLGIKLVYLYFLVPFCGTVIALSPFYKNEQEA